MKNVIQSGLSSRIREKCIFFMLIGKSIVYVRKKEFPVTTV